MSILIKGIEMPTDGEAVVLIISNENGKMLAEVDEYCGAVYESVPIPPHGRLIDADVLSVAILNSKYWDNADEDVAWELVQDAPTVIEAEGEE